MKKFMLDTNIFFIDPNCIVKFEENEVYIPTPVLEELDKHKGDEGTDGYNVRKALQSINENKLNVTFVGPSISWVEERNLDKDVMDNLILSCATRIEDCVIVTNDLGMRIKADAFGILNQEYQNVKQVSVGNIRKGKHEIHDDDVLLSELYQKGSLPITEEMFENDWVLFYREGKIVEVGVVVDGAIVQGRYTDKRPPDVKYRNIEQKILASHMYDGNLECLSVCGEVGSGKTFLALNIALDLITRRKYKKLYICKSPEPLNRRYNVGFLPGTFYEKILPTIAPFTSNLATSKKDVVGNSISGTEILTNFIEYGIIEIVDLANLQGNNFDENSIIILDEFQTIDSMRDGRAILSRVKEDSLVVCLGDLKQTNSSNVMIEKSALYHLINVFSGYERYAHIVLERVERSPFVDELTKRW